jgi:hypothetical protein
MATFWMGETVDGFSIGDDSDADSGANSDVDQRLFDCMMSQSIFCISSCIDICIDGR